MAEQLGDLQLTKGQATAVVAIGQEALVIVDATYGTGYPHFRGGQHNLAYHNGYHGRAVAADGVRVGEAMGFSRAELVTTEVAGDAHDIVQLLARGEMERRSADWLVHRLRSGNHAGVIAEAGAFAILGTEPVIEGGKVVGQVATQLAYPSKSAERVSLAVACGDFGRMLTPIGPYLSHRLWQQIKGAKPDEVPTMEGFVNFQKAQIELYENYRFPLRQAEGVLATHRREVIAYSRRLLAMLEDGRVATWEQVVAMDLQFMQQHSR